jgi:hypothetical protein
MKNSLVILALFATFIGIAQKEGQNFCTGNNIYGEYFDFSIKEKKIFWYKTYYIEKQIGTKTINGKNYFEYSQIWESGDSDILYLRTENSSILEYDTKLNIETIRFDSNFNLDYSWQKMDKTVLYTIKSFNASLITPFCKYENVLSIEAKYEKVTYNFYYLKGFGYVGATKNDKLISYVTPEK